MRKKVEKKGVVVRRELDRARPNTKAGSAPGATASNSCRQRHHADQALPCCRSSRWAQSDRPSQAMGSTTAYKAAPCRSRCVSPSQNRLSRGCRRRSVLPLSFPPVGCINEQMQLLPHRRFQGRGCRAHKLDFAETAPKPHHIRRPWQLNLRKHGVGLSLDHISSNSSFRPALGNHRAEPDIIAVKHSRAVTAHIRQ